MKRIILVLSLALLLAAGALTAARAEVKEWFFPLAQGIYRDGQKFFDGDGIVILPGRVEGIQRGSKYPFFVEKDGKRVEVGWGTVTGVNFWESNAVLHLNDGVRYITTACFVRVPVDVDKCFATWWDYGVKWEKEGKIFDAFCAYYRATVYRPDDRKVTNAYRRTGYMHYLAQAKQLLSAKRYEEALAKFEFALLFAWPGGDVSEAREGADLCRNYLDAERRYEERMSAARTAAKNGDYRTAVENCLEAWVGFLAGYGSDAAKASFMKEAALCWKGYWEGFAASARSRLSDGKADEAYLDLLRHCRFIPMLPSASRRKLAGLLAEAKAALKPGTRGFAVASTLDYLAARLTPKGYFSNSPDDPPSKKADVLTALSLAAFARLGSTASAGPYSAQVAGALKWARKIQNEKGAFCGQDRSTLQVLYTWALAEYLLATGDVSVRPMLSAAFADLEERQRPDGTFGVPLIGYDPLLEMAFAAIAVERAKQASLHVPEKLAAGIKSFALAHMDGRNKVLLDSRGKTPRPGTPEDVFLHGAVMSAYKATSAQFLTTETLDYILRIRDHKPSLSVLSPDGWFFCANVLSAFAPEQWTAFRSSLWSALASGTRVEDGSWSFPFPGRNRMFRSLGLPGLAAFNALTVSLVLGMD